MQRGNYHPNGYPEFDPTQSWGENESTFPETFQQPQYGGYGGNNYRGGPPPTQRNAVDPMRPITPEPLRHQYQQPGKPPRRPRKKRHWGRWIGLTFAILLILLLVLGGILGKRAYDFGQAISPQSPLSSQINLSSGSRVNLLVMGFGGGNHPGAYLTDSMLIVSIDPQTGKTALISVPRDLWVQIPPNSGQYGKINAAYEYGLYNGYGTEKSGKIAAGDLAARKITDVTGLSVKYWLTLDFQGFRKLVDALGGVDVNVQNTFTALYPKNDDPSIDASYIQVHFDAGMQHMNGERAIEYARARKSLDNPIEGTDFARSARQQILIKAIVAKMTQVSSWPHLFGALDALQTSLYTNLSASDLYAFVRKMDVGNAKRIGLNNDNVLVDSTADNQYILAPRDSWAAVQQYIQQQLSS